MSLDSRLKFSIRISLLSFLAVLSFESYSQGLGNSPYTALGLGELYNEGFAANQATGGAGVAGSSSAVFNINNLNPALWVRNRFTTFEFAGIGQYKSARKSGVDQRDLGGNLAYFALSFPVMSGKWNSGFSLKPYSFVDYGTYAVGEVAGTSYQALYEYTGKGAINKASFTNSFQLGRYLSAGIEASYLFGNVRKSTLGYLVGGSSITPAVSQNDRVSYSDVAIKGGVSAKIPLLKENKLLLNVGQTFSYGGRISGRQNVSIEVTQNELSVQAPDTLIKNRKGYTQTPHIYRSGVSLEWPYKLTIYADYERQDWDSFRDFSRKTGTMKSVDRYFVGAELIPNSRSTRLIDQVVFRAGASHGEMPYKIGTTKLYDTNASIGASIPFGQGRANSCTFTLVGGKRGVVSRNTVEEYYGRVVIGLTLVEQWFTRQRLD